MKNLFTILFSVVLLSIDLIAAIPVKVVIVSMFEYGADTGDLPGEFQFWVERNDTQKIEAPCLLYTSPSPRDLSTSRMPSSA